MLVDMLRSGRFKSQHSEDTQRSKQPLLFISHSHEDSCFVDALVELLRSIGFNGTNMFCSSVEGYGVTEGNDIYDTLKNLFRQYDIYVVFVLSDHYYSSAACLNEMGAAWVLQSNYSTILIPGFKPCDIQGRSTRIKRQSSLMTIDLPEVPSMIFVKGLWAYLGLMTRMMI